MGLCVSGPIRFVYVRMARASRYVSAWVRACVVPFVCRACVVGTCRMRFVYGSFGEGRFMCGYRVGEGLDGPMGS